MVHKSSPPVAAIIGDVIASRDSGDRENLQKNLVGVMAGLNSAHEAIQPLTMTVGDEFQGLYGDLSKAFEVALRLRVELMPSVDVRVGIGWGELTLVPADPPFGQDGPCWWRARDAIDEVKRSESLNSVPNSLRTMSRTGTDADALLNGYLGLRDHIVSDFDDLDARLAILRLEGFSQVEMARSVGLSQSSVSRRLQNHGISAVVSGQPATLVVPK